MKILLAIDDSGFSEAAVKMVATQNRPETTNVLVLNVVEPINRFYSSICDPLGYYAPPYPYSKELEEENLRRGRDLVNRAAETLCSAGFHVDREIREGSPRPEIVDFAAAWHADLIVIGSHGRTGLQRVLLGSVSDFVSRHAKCSVEIVRLPEELAA